MTTTFFSFSMLHLPAFFFFFFNDPAPTEIYTLPLHDALPICKTASAYTSTAPGCGTPSSPPALPPANGADRKSTRLNSSHSQISYAVFCLKKKKKNKNTMSGWTSNQQS